ncbi:MULTISPECIES: PIN domain-containing protein [Chromatiaceae]|uniref:PIN domain-containing protein n=1 Tax=Lamprobacter modestohalophilus TaxID=1064514 RepID=A0A9X0W712_9GAMM|nr:MULTISPECIES: PIN domain-containing protein [Chromatiaceae]MBK1617448.1 PIN domain-containing protein [Lamprobacter modestohalophilus]MBK5940339.1 PIN domain-containing protein [Halochromatium roseum]
MARHARYTAVLDACVLYSIAVTDALMSLATAGLFAAKWTVKIEDEWIRALETRRPDLAGKLDVRRDSMRAAVPDWEIPSAQWQRLNLIVELPDPDDAHVLAAAVAGQTDCIVTDNLRDFPADILNAFEIEAIDPDTFIVHQLDLHPIAAISAFKRMRARRKKPETTPDEFANALENAGLASTAERLREAAELI